MKQQLFGGEFYYSNSSTESGLNNRFNYFVLGARTAIHLTISYLLRKGIRSVLLPSYLCTSIIDEFNRKDIEIKFYSINRDFSFDKEEVLSLLNHETGAYFINYFGLSMSFSDLSFIEKLTNEGFYIIYDSVHDLNEIPLGTFSFNSYRKVMPYSLSVLKSEYDLSKEYSTLGYNADYYTAVQDARERKSVYICEGLGREEDYVRKFERAEELYYESYSVANPMETMIVLKADLDFVRKRKVENYIYLLQKLMDNKDIDIVFKDIGGKIPFCMPIYINVLDRNQLRKKLIEEGVFLPIHWELSSDSRIYSKKTKEMSSRIISIPIDYRYSKKEIEIFVKIFNRVLMEIGGNNV